jgi:hypothetical protein
MIDFRFRSLTDSANIVLRRAHLRQIVGRKVVSTAEMPMNIPRRPRLILRLPFSCVEFLPRLSGLPFYLLSPVKIVRTERSLVKRYKAEVFAGSLPDISEETLDVVHPFFRKYASLPSSPPQTIKRMISKRIANRDSPVTPRHLIVFFAEAASYSALITTIPCAWDGLRSNFERGWIAIAQQCSIVAVAQRFRFDGTKPANRAFIIDRSRKSFALHARA